MPDDFEPTLTWVVKKAKMDFPADNADHYLAVMAAYSLYFAIINMTSHCVFLCWNKKYTSLEPGKRTEYRANVIAIFHSVIAVFLSSLGMWWVCRPGENVFNSNQCIDTPKYIHLWALMHSVGYFIVDTINYIFLVKEKKPSDMQNIGHHIIAITTFCGTLFFMNFTVVFGVMLLFVEVSTPFVCIRWLIYAHDAQGSVWNAVNSIMIFLSFLLGRLTFQLYILFTFGYPKLTKMFKESTMPYWKVTILMQMFAAITIAAFMNIYWMWLIIKQLARVIQRIVGGESGNAFSAGGPLPDGMDG